jgi:glutamine amidotransferase
MLAKYMCRILGFIGRHSVYKKISDELIKGIVGASRYDPYAVRAFGREEASHKDGWGRLRIFLGAGKTSIYLYRSTEPIFIDRPSEDSFETNIVRYSDPLMIDFIHARAASTGNPVNIFSAHPFETATKRGYKIFLMHNGTVDKYKVAETLENKVSEDILKNYSDTYILALKLGELLDEDVDINVLRKIKEYVKSALNIGLVLLAENKVSVVFGSYYKDNGSKDLKNYYKLYMTDLTEKNYEERNIIFASSTLVDFREYRPSFAESWRELENGEYHIIRIERYKDKEMRISSERFMI